jgi:multimeric flavodoxin WrbA
MKVIAFNGSPRKDGNTSILISKVFAPLEAAGIETEVFQLGGSDIHGCRACYACFKEKNRRCAFNDDVANECIAKMLEADGVILASTASSSEVRRTRKSLAHRELETLWKCAHTGRRGMPPDATRIARQ